ncbi:hypothetical protein [Burkholderia ubonensis]|uniref:hypothetical protein n=1 Tax=Burkholderia ubonensis TaxID=101571 RepID=UPI002ABE8A04|nr:hypothetical protein [Burkholderia ubonensis]
MIADIVIGFVVGIAIAVPVWIIARHLGLGRGFRAPRRIDPHDVVPCEIAPVALRGRLLPGAADVAAAAGREEAR